LLDALTRSGSLPICCAELHVVVALSHCFPNSVMGTILQDNMNTIEKVDHLLLILASTIYSESVSRLIDDEEEVQRLCRSFPRLLASPNDDEKNGA
jgi:hypothetical protein